MDKTARDALRAATDEVAGWVSRAQGSLSFRAGVEGAAAAAVAKIRGAFVEASDSSGAQWQVLPLAPQDGPALSAVARGTQLLRIAPDRLRALHLLTTSIDESVKEARALLGVRRFFNSGSKKEAGEAAALRLAAFREAESRQGMPALLDALARDQERQLPAVSPDSAFDEWVGLGYRVADLGRNPVRADPQALAPLPAAIAAIGRAVAEDGRHASAVADTAREVRRSEAARVMADMPVEALKDATRDRIRVTPLTDAGLTTVGSVLGATHLLERLPGIGATTATRIRGAAQTLWQTTYDEMPARIDIQRRSKEATAMLQALRSWDATRTLKGATADLARAERLAPLATALASRRGTVVTFLLGNADAGTAELYADVSAVVRRAAHIGQATPSRGVAGDPWEDFQSRPADYFAMLAELGILTEDEEKAHGDLPEEIIDAVRRLELDTDYLSASLRGYQSFGARFALVQRKVIIGDEMGLGKTIEALAVLAHLRSKGHHHLLVVCPAAVVTNWFREVLDKSTLRPHRAHGPGRDAAVRNWVRSGGVAITTFESLGWFERHLPSISELGCVIVDEAHYVKNPAAQRSRRTAEVIRYAQYALLMTGTPLENRIDEFRNLVGYLRPDLAVTADELAPRQFRRQVAPVYLRRNQEDVLTELPELVEVSEWLPMSREDQLRYGRAVAEGNFQAMRQAAMIGGATSEKMQRLIELVGEAEENERKVIVFSHFREVLDLIARALPGQVVGPLNGSVPATARQDMVDRFARAGHGAVLVAQIVAGGVGLNIQAASVVIICEPQLKPTIEWQAIARAHRMGQLNSVQVHRLLSEVGVDIRVTEILAKKRQLFDEFARVSATATSAPEALDVSESDLAREVIAAERERLFANPSPL